MKSTCPPPCARASSTSRRSTRRCAARSASRFRLGLSLTLLTPAPTSTLTLTPNPNQVRRTLRLRFRLGLFDPIADQPMWHVPPEAVQSAEHVAAAVDATAQGLVLLLNGGGVVPGGRAGAAAPAVAAVPAAAAAVSAVAASAAADPPVLPFRAGRKLAVVGPHANDRSTILGNYLGQMCADGFASRACVPSAFEALARRNDNGGPARTVNATGCAVNSTDVSGMAAAVAAAAAADAIVFVGGLDVTPPLPPPLPPRPSPPPPPHPRPRPRPRPPPPPHLSISPPALAR